MFSRFSFDWRMIATFSMVIFALAFTACGEEEDNCPDPNNPDCTNNAYILTDVTVGGTTYTQVAGTLNEDFTMDAATNWMISGGVFVASGATLTIEAGTTVYAADDATTPFLAIAQGAKINAAGTAAEPIVLTSIKELTGGAAPGDWGGIIVNGYGVLNSGTTAEGEGGTGVYGGSDNADNSGTLSYVVVAYAGKILGTDNELNGFSFNGVGSGTQVDHIQAYFGSDDGIEFFGGAVNVKYAVSTGNEDDSFDWTLGWSGNGQFWVVNQSTGGGDRGIEADSNGDDNAATPFSNPNLSNLTLVGADDGDGDNQALKLREGTKGRIHNMIVTGFPKRGVQVQHDQTIANMNDGSLVVANSRIDNANPWVGTASDDSDVEVSFANDPTNSTAGAGLVGYVGTVSEGAVDPAAALGSWFTSTNYVGAVPTGDDWTTGWTK